MVEIFEKPYWIVPAVLIFVGCKTIQPTGPIYWNQGKETLLQGQEGRYRLAVFGIEIYLAKEFDFNFCNMYQQELYRIGSQQTQDSWAETDRIPISKRCNDVWIDSAGKVLGQWRFTRHTIPQHEIWLN